MWRSDSSMWTAWHQFMHLWIMLRSLQCLKRTNSIDVNRYKMVSTTSRYLSYITLSYSTPWIPALIIQAICSIDRTFLFYIYRQTLQIRRVGHITRLNLMLYRLLIKFACFIWILTVVLDTLHHLIDILSYGMIYFGRFMKNLLMSLKIVIWSCFACEMIDQIKYFIVMLCLNFL